MTPPRGAVGVAARAPEVCTPAEPAFITEEPIVAEPIVEQPIAEEPIAEQPFGAALRSVSALPRSEPTEHMARTALRPAGTIPIRRAIKPRSGGRLEFSSARTDRGARGRPLG